MPPRAAKGFNFVSAKLWFCALIRGSQNLGAPCEGVRLVTFCIVQKVTKKHTGLRPATSIQSSVGNDFGEASGGTSQNRFFAQNGGEKALNRCEIPVLQRKDLGRRLKEQPYSFADSRLWLGGNLWCLEWKRIALDSKKKKFEKRKAFGLQKKATFKCS